MSNVRRAPAKYLPLTYGFVAKNAYWFQECPLHGNTEHLAVIGGRCVECQTESLEKDAKDRRTP